MIGFAEKLKGLLKKRAAANPQRHRVIEHAEFLRLLQLLQQDQKLRTTVQRLLELDDFHRQSMLNSVIHQLRMQRAPRSHLAILAFLRDPQVCARVRALLDAF